MNVFGRLEAPDERDKNYPMRAAIADIMAAAPARITRYWNDSGWWGNQGSMPWCVAYAVLHWAEDGPITHKLVPPPLIPASDVYHRAQLIDEWPGENYDGTSVRAGMKVLQEHGLVQSYHWAANVQDIVDAILEVGPVVMGTRWYRGMSYPVRDFMFPTGDLLGGHAYVLNGVNVAQGKFRMKNSWGRNWGKNGRAWIDFGSVQRLLDQNGEACLAIEIRD